jgi:phosphomethylpyrimidine synthase
MDLSTGGDLDACREAIIEQRTVPDRHRPDLLDDHRQEDRGPRSRDHPRDRRAPGEQGVDYLTIHAGILKAHLPLVKDRLIGIVSRGGSLLAKWMLIHNAENPMYSIWDDICEIMREHDVTLLHRRRPAPRRARRRDGQGAARRARDASAN